jgi:hypothetical protein
MYNVRNCVDIYKAVTKTDVNDPLVLTGGRVTNFFNYCNFDLIFFIQNTYMSIVT